MKKNITLNGNVTIDNQNGNNTFCGALPKEILCLSGMNKNIKSAFDGKQNTGDDSTNAELAAVEALVTRSLASSVHFSTYSVVLQL